MSTPTDQREQHDQREHIFGSVEDMLACIRAALRFIDALPQNDAGERYYMEDTARSEFEELEYRAVNCTEAKIEEFLAAVRVTARAPITLLNDAEHLQ